MIYDSAITFLNKVSNHLQDQGVQLGNWEIDHLCYRTDSLAHYEETKEHLSQLGELLIESDIGGRPIATFKLEKPIVFNNSYIELIEVPAPKKGRKVQSGFEHLEVIIDCSFQEIIDANPTQSFQDKGLTKELNPELAIDYGDYAIKFHHKSLEHIINIEKHAKAMNFLRTSKILSKLSQFSPLISGTIPLAIDNKLSDLDILFSANSLSEFSNRVQEFFSQYEDFTLKQTIHQELDCIVVNFVYDSLKIELFCNQKQVFRQQANIHFLVEGRILKLANSDFKERIIDLKKDGLATEPAFGKLLKLPSPYENLLTLNDLSDRELSERFSLNKNFIRN